MDKRSEISSGLKDIIREANSVDLHSLSKNYKEYKSLTKRTFALTASRNQSASVYGS